jgi:hypothetical protein
MMKKILRDFILKIGTTYHDENRDEKDENIERTPEIA